MGFLDIFSDMFGGASPRKNERALKTLKNSKAMKEDRWASLEYFKDLEDAEIAVPALLERFEYSLEHGINDTKEKELALNGIVKHGTKAINFIQSHLLKTTRIAWPIKALNSVAPPEDAVEILKKCLNFGDIAFDRDAVEKNYDILCYLRDYQIKNFTKEISHFLSDPDERVRFACVEVLLEQDDSKIPGMIENFILDGSSENRRIHQAVVDAFLQKKWRIQDRSKLQEKLTTFNLRINKEDQLERL